MRKKMERLASKLNESVMYFTENPINFDGQWDGCKYFLVWQNTHHIYRAFRTQAECIEGLEELIEEKIVWCGSYGFTVIEDD